MSQLFGRVYRLEIGDEGETLLLDGFDPGRFGGGVASQPAQIRFRVAHNITGYQSIAEITVYGLSYASRLKAYTRYDRVRLTAGFADRHGEIFSGTVYNVGIGRDGPDSFITLLCTAGGRAYDFAFMNQAFGPNTPVRELIEAAARQMGIPTTYVGDMGDLGRTQGGMTISQTARSFLRRMGQTFRFTWHIENDELVISNDDSMRDMQHRYSAETGMIGSPQIHERGLDVRVLMDATLKPLDEVIVENATGDLAFGSRVLTYQGTIGIGRYVARSVVHSGDFYGDDWSTVIECFNPREPSVRRPGDPE